MAAFAAPNIAESRKVEMRGRGVNSRRRARACTYATRRAARGCGRVPTGTRAPVAARRSGGEAGSGRPGSRTAVAALTALSAAVGGAVGGGCGRAGHAPLAAHGPLGAADAGAPAAAAEVVWRQDVGPSVFAAPWVVDGIAVVATGKGDVVALSPRTGGRVWRRGVGGPVRGLVVEGGRVYVATDRKGGRLAVLALADGRELWSRDVGAAAHGPILADGAVIVATDSGRVTALDATTGAVRWQARLAGDVAAQPVAAGGAVLVATRTDTLYHLEPTSGAVVGRTPLPAGVSAPPVVRSDGVLIPLYSGAVVGYDPAARVVRWRAGVGAPSLAAPVVTPRGDAYVLTEEAAVWRIPAGTGAAERIAELGGAAVGALTLAGDRLIVGRLDGTLYGLTLDGTILWQTRLGDSIVAPAAVDGSGVLAALRRGTVTRVEVRR